MSDDEESGFKWECDPSKLTSEERELLNRYGERLRAGANGDIRAKTEQQRHFVLAVRRHVEPRTKWERLWIKYRECVRKEREARKRIELRSQDKRQRSTEKESIDPVGRHPILEVLRGNRTPANQTQERLRRVVLQGDAPRDETERYWLDFCNTHDWRTPVRPATKREHDDRTSWKRMGPYRDGRSYYSDF